MLELTVRRTVTSPEYQVFTENVILNNVEKLTPKTARAAIRVAFGSGTGEVTCDEGYGYKVYPNSVRKFKVYNF